MRAAAGGSPECVRALINAGADLEARDRVCVYIYVCACVCLFVICL
jgi:hypothetical protein